MVPLDLGLWKHFLCDCLALSCALCYSSRVMKIKSSFKDYYDFVATRYGGGDPKIVYVRGRIAPKDHFVVVVSDFPLADPVSWPSSNAPYRLAYLVVAGKAYLLHQPKDIWPSGIEHYRLCDPAKIASDDARERAGNRRWVVRSRTFGLRDEPFEFKRAYEFLVDFSRLVKAPVFIVEGVQSQFGSREVRVAVAGRCPILDKIGMAQVVPPEQMYQDLAYFVGNTMNPSPDTKPPVEVSNRDKIVAAGFDLRRSFRHRS